VGLRFFFFFIFFLRLGLIWRYDIQSNDNQIDSESTLEHFDDFSENIERFGDTEAGFQSWTREKLERNIAATGMI